MISHLNGTISSKALDSVVIDINGVGYLLQMPSSDIINLPSVGENAFISCVMVVSDSSVALYGFGSEAGRFLFDSLRGVSGIGPKMALAILSMYEPSEIERLIASQDVKALSKVPGVGKKTASRIVLELKDAFDVFDAVLSDNSAPEVNSKVLAVREALSSMGFTTAEIDDALSGADVQASEEELLKYALRRRV